MTETQGTTALGPGAASGAPDESGRTSGAAGTSTRPVDAAATESVASGSRPAVGRASVPVDSSSGSTGGTATARYTRPPGMVPPPDALPAEPATENTATGATVAVPPGHHAGTTTVPVVPAGSVAVAAPASGNTTAGATLPAGTEGTDAPGGGAVGTATVPVGVRPGVGVAGTRVPGGTVPVRPLPAGAAGARVPDAMRTARTTSSAAAARGPRRARLAVKRVDPWSVMKFSFAVSLVLFIVTIVATAVLYLALDRMGVFDSVNKSLGDLAVSAGGTEGSGGFKITARGVLGTAALLGVVNIVLVTALATLGAFIYNVCADLVGGIELTLSERD